MASIDQGHEWRQFNWRCADCGHRWKAGGLHG